MSWPIVKVGQISKQVRGVSYSSGDAIDKPKSGYIALLRANNIDERGLNFDDLQYVPETKVSNSQILTKNDILIAASSGSLNIVGKAGKFDNENECTFGAFCKVIRPTDDVDPNYFANYFQTKTYRKTISSLAAGANINNLRNEHIDNLQIPLPPLAEQKRIAAILDKADEIRRKREQTIAKLDQLAQSIFVDMFGNLLVNSKGWDFKTVGDGLKAGLITDLQDGNHGEIHPKSSDFVENGVPFIMANCMDNGNINYEKAYKLDESWLKKLRIGFAKPNDVLLSHKGTVGEVGIVSSNYQVIILSPQTTYYRTSTGLNSVFLAGFFKTAWFQAILKKDAIQSTRAYIGITRQKELPFFLPPLELQEQFANRIEKLEQLKADNLAALAKQTQLFASLQHQAFTGQL